MDKYENIVIRNIWFVVLVVNDPGPRHGPFSLVRRATEPGSDKKQVSSLVAYA